MLCAVTFAQPAARAQDPKGIMGNVVPDNSRYHTYGTPTEAAQDIRVKGYKERTPAQTRDPEPVAEDEMQPGAEEAASKHGEEERDRWKREEVEKWQRVVRAKTGEKRGAGKNKK